MMDLRATLDRSGLWNVEATSPQGEDWLRRATEYHVIGSLYVGQFGDKAIEAGLTVTFVSQYDTVTYPGKPS